jgi:hypothetical protein
MGASFFAILSSVIIRHLNVNRTIRGPNETYPELVVDPDRMLPFPVAAQRFESVAGRRPQITKGRGGVKVTKLASCNRQDAGRDALPAFTVKHGFRPRILEAFDHATNVSSDDTNIQTHGWHAASSLRLSSPAKAGDPVL